MRGDPEARRTVNHLLEHPAVQKHGKGISSEELAQFHRMLTEEGAARFLGIGAEQYVDGLFQAFEYMSKGVVKSELIDELVDVQNYVTMLAIKVLSALRERNDTGRESRGTQAH